MPLFPHLLRKLTFITRTSAFTLIIIGNSRVTLAQNENDNVTSSIPIAPIVSGLHATKISDDLQGRILTEEMNCIACHQSDANFSKSSKKAPRLIDIASRVNPHYLKNFIADPHKTKPGTTMPDLLAGKTITEKEDIAESITHYLLSLKPKNDKAFTPAVPDSVAAKSGKQLFHSRGCASCHSPRDEDGKETMSLLSTPLGDLGKKYSHQSLVDFLKNPHKVRPSGRMPKLNLPDKELNNIAHYLLKDIQIPGNIHYTLYHGSIWEGINTDGVQPVKGGHVVDFDLKKLDNKRRGYAVEYQTWLEIPELGAGEHTFYISMNGGSLSINNIELFSKAPSQNRAPQEFKAATTLNAGKTPFRLIYYNTGDKPSLKVEVKGPSTHGKRTPIPINFLSVSKEHVTAFQPIQSDPKLAIKGRQHFTALGCASCHDDLSLTPLPAISSVKFSDLTPNNGCLSESSKATPKYYFDDQQRKLINTFIKKKSHPPLTDLQQIHKTLTTFNCTACHEREGVGGIDPARLEFFTSTHHELGDQGRIPPTLSHVGAKLQPSWIHKVLTEGMRQRDYMNTIMPQFGEDNIGHLTELFGKVDKLEEVTLPVIESIKESKNAGYDMIGPKGFSCVACHHFNGKNSSGAGALDLVNATQSLQKNWFHLFMQNPSRFHDTGIMPTFWPGGKSTRPDVLNGKPDQQIEALWNYLADGPRAKKPAGLSRQSNEVRVFDRAEIVRGRGTAGFRGIGVGYPQRLNLAFDTEEMALRVLWKGTFADVNHGSFRISGKEQIKFPAGIPFHQLDSLDLFWPYKSKTNYTFPQDHGYQFLGYRLDDLRRPTFQYRYGEILIDDFFEDILLENGTSKFVRTFSFDSPEKPELFHFRAGAGAKIIEAPNNGTFIYKIDKLTVRIDHSELGSKKPIIRKGTPNELIVPLQLPKGKSKLSIEYQW